MPSELRWYEPAAGGKVLVQFECEEAVQLAAAGGRWGLGGMEGRLWGWEAKRGARRVGEEGGSWVVGLVHKALLAGGSSGAA